jgi:hypothetical protein
MTIKIVHLLFENGDWRSFRVKNPTFNTNKNAVEVAVESDRPNDDYPLVLECATGSVKAALSQVDDSFVAVDHDP